MIFSLCSFIGKTELAKQVAKYLHKDNKKVGVSLDLICFGTKIAISQSLWTTNGFLNF